MNSSDRADVPPSAALATTSRYERVRSSRPSGRLSRLPTASFRDRPVRSCCVGLMSTSSRSVIAPSASRTTVKTVRPSTAFSNRRVYRSCESSRFRSSAAPEKQQRGRHGDEEDPFDRRQHELHVVRQLEQPQDAVRGDDPDDGYSRVDQRVAHRHLPRRAAPPLAGFRPVCRHSSRHRITLYLGDSSATDRTLHPGSTPADRMEPRAGRLKGRRGLGATLA